MTPCGSLGKWDFVMGGYEAGDLVVALKSVEIYCCALAVSSLVLLPWCLATWIVCFNFCKCAQIWDVHSVN